MPDVIWYMLLSATVKRQVHQVSESLWSGSQSVRTGVALNDSRIVEVNHFSDERAMGRQKGRRISSWGSSTRSRTTWYHTNLNAMDWQGLQSIRYPSQKFEAVEMAIQGLR
jgi:hypothetical protein